MTDDPDFLFRSSEQEADISDSPAKETSNAEKERDRLRIHNVGGSLKFLLQVLFFFFLLVSLARLHCKPLVIDMGVLFLGLDHPKQSKALEKMLRDWWCGVILWLT